MRQAVIDTIGITMTPRQCRMARAALKWSIDDLAEAASVARMTVVRFEREDRVSDTSAAAMRLAFEQKRVKFVDKGRLAGAVYGGTRPA